MNDKIEFGRKKYGLSVFFLLVAAFWFWLGFEVGLDLMVGYVRLGDINIFFLMLLCLFLVFPILVGVFILMLYVNTCIEVEDSGLRFSDWRRKKVFVPWGELDQVVYKSGLYKYIFHTRGGGCGGVFLDKTYGGAACDYFRKNRCPDSNIRLIPMYAPALQGFHSRVV